MTGFGTPLSPRRRATWRLTPIAVAAVLAVTAIAGAATAVAGSPAPSPTVLEPAGLPGGAATSVPYPGPVAAVDPRHDASVSASARPPESVEARSIRTVPYEFYSIVLDKTVRGEVFLPEHEPGRGKKLPVLYLLHGNANETQGGFGPAVRDELLDDLARFGIVGVLHDSGSAWSEPRREQPREVRWEVGWPQGNEPTIGINRGSVEVDEAGYTLGQQPYERHMLTELLPFIEARWHVRRDRGGRGVLGHSGGHYGAFILGARHPDVFGFIAGSSGPVSWRHEAFQWHLGTAVALAWGGRDPVTDEFFHRARDPKELAINWRGTHTTVMHSAGCVDPATSFGDPTCEVEGFVRPINDDFAKQADSLGYDARGSQGVYYSYHPQDGADQRTHDVRAVGIPVYVSHFLPAAAAMFNRPRLPAPTTFDYRLADRDVTVWDWTFHVDRPNREFLTLTGVSPSGFRAQGTGDLTVVTPPVYEPDRRHRVRVELPNGHTVDRTVLSDTSGRLRFTVRLGEPRLVDQHSVLEAAAQFPFEVYNVSILQTDAVSVAPAPECPPVHAHPVVRCTSP